MNPLESLSPRTKSVLILLLTLLLGAVLGALVNAWLAHQRFDRLRSLRTEPGFIRVMERAIEPQDAAQQEAIRAVLEQTADRMNAIQRERREEMRALVDSMKAQLAPVLTERQMDRLEQRLRFGGPAPDVPFRRPGFRREGPPNGLQR